MTNPVPPLRELRLELFKNQNRGWGLNSTAMSLLRTPGHFTDSSAGYHKTVPFSKSRGTPGSPHFASPLGGSAVDKQTTVPS